MIGFPIIIVNYKLRTDYIEIMKSKQTHCLISEVQMFLCDLISITEQLFLLTGYEGFKKKLL